ncbi:MAG: putative DNA-binding domain-containing protein [Candidatus Omnitrophica bacterium]|nr:putative DNA-binding domain-containing protein [Candidatus Omnitrophota bacterium]
MPDLIELQRWMKRRILPGRPDAVPAKEEFLFPQGGVPGEERLGVYAEGYIVRMREALAEVYEAVEQVVGRETFAELAREYAACHPSRDYDLSKAGRQFPQFLAAHPTSRELPFLADLAALEWSVSEAFHSFEQPPMPTSQLADVPPGALGGIRIHFQPSVHRAHSAWPVLDIWEQRNRPREEVSVDLVDRPQRVLIYRQGVRVFCETMEPAQDDLLAGLLAGRTLGEACGDLLVDEGKGQVPISEWFAGWVQKGLITGVEPAEA